MPKAMHEALRRKGDYEESAYKIMNSQKTKRKAKKGKTLRQIARS